MGARNEKHKKEIQRMNNLTNLQMMHSLLSYSALNSMLNYNTTKVENSAFQNGFNRGMNNGLRLNATPLAFNPFIPPCFDPNLNPNGLAPAGCNTVENKLINNMIEQEKPVGRGLKDIELQNEKFKFNINFNT